MYIPNSIATLTDFNNGIIKINTIIYLSTLFKPLLNSDAYDNILKYVKSIYLSLEQKEVFVDDVNKYKEWKKFILDKIKGKTMEGSINLNNVNMPNDTYLKILNIIIL